MPRDAKRDRADRKAALKLHGADCLVCGCTQVVEIHHVYGTDNRDTSTHRPLCYLCHLVAPAGDKYWEWERSGDPGWVKLAAWLVKQVETADAGEARRFLKREPSDKMKIALGWATYRKPSHKINKK